MVNGATNCIILVVVIGSWHGPHRGLSRDLAIFLITSYYFVLCSHLMEYPVEVRSNTKM